MAVAARKRVVVNRGRPRRNTARRKLSAKQIKFFGTPAQKAALKRSRHSKRSKPNKGAPFSRKTRRAKAKSHRSRTSPRKRSNPGDILSLALLPAGNPGRKKRSKSMAAPRKRRRNRARTSQRRNTRRRAARKNPGTRMHRRRNSHRTTHRRRTTRRNPGSGGVNMKSGMMIGAGAIGGFVTTKLITQTILGAKNTGPTGYFGNLMATAGLAFIAHKLNAKNLSLGILIGGVLQVAVRAVFDNTSLGQLGTSFGMGDYQMQNFVTPQRLVDPLNSAQIEIPSGWGAPPAVVINGASAPGGVHGYNAPGPGLYSSKGLYS